MARGGARPGAGRPSTRAKFEKPVDLAEAKIKEALPQVITRLLGLARDDDSAIALKACIYLADRILGKPLQQVKAEVGGDPEGTPLRIVVEYDDAISRPDTPTEAALSTATYSG